MSRIAMLVAAAIAVSACAVVDEPIALDDAYDVPVGQIHNLAVLTNDYLPAQQLNGLAVVRGPGWLTADVDELVADVPDDFEEGSFGYAVGDQEVTAEVRLRGIHVRARIEREAAAVRAREPHSVVAKVEQRIGSGVWRPLPGAQVSLEIDADTAGARFATEPACRTGDAGACRLELSAMAPGRAVLRIATLTTADGLAVDVGSAAAVDVAWVEADIRLSDDTAVLVGDEARISASVRVHDGYRWVDATDVDVDVDIGGDGPARVVETSCDLPVTGSCHVVLVSTEPATADLVATAAVTAAGVHIVASVDGAADDTGSAAWATAAIELSDDIQVAAGDTATVAAEITLFDGGVPTTAPAGVVVDMALAIDAASRPPGATPSARSCTTNAIGRCEITVRAQRPGRVHVTATAVVEVAGLEVPVRSAGAEGGSGSVTWLTASLDVTAEARARAGEAVLLTATVTVDDGIDRTKRPGVRVAFSSSAATVGRECDTTASGSCRVNARRTAPGTAVLRAEATIPLAGGHVEVTDDATTTWLDATLTIIAASSGVAEAGDPLSVTASVMLDDGSGPGPAAAAVVVLSGEAAEPATETCMTEAGGSCTASFTRSSAGEAVISATGLRIDGIEFAANEFVTLRWVDARIVLAVEYSPGISSGDFATVLATVESNAGDDWVARDVPVRFRPDSRLGTSGSCTTDAGSCSMRYGMPGPGGYPVVAAAEVSVGGLDLSRTATVDVFSIAAEITIVQDDLVVLPNAGGSREVVVRVRVSDGAWRAYEGATVEFRASEQAGIEFDPTTCSTGVGGRCSVEVRSDRDRTIVVFATTSVEMHGRQASDSASAEFRWFTPTIFIPPPTTLPDPLR